MVRDSGLRARTLQSVESLAFFVDLGPKRTFLKLFSGLSICHLLSFEIKDFPLVDEVIFEFFVFLDSVFGQKFTQHVYLRFFSEFFNLLKFFLFLIFCTCLDCIKVFLLDFGFVVQATGDFCVDSAEL
jgi:hypothetical protein